MGAPGRRPSTAGAASSSPSLSSTTSRLHRGAEGKTAARIAMRQKTGSVGTLLDHSDPRPTRNHARDNVRALRELQRNLRDRKAAEEKASADSPFKLQQFERVPSRFLLQSPPRTTGSGSAQARASSTPSTPSRCPAGFGSCVSRGLTPAPSSPAAPSTSTGRVSVRHTAPCGPCSPYSPEMTPVKDRNASRGQLRGTPEKYELGRKHRPQSAPQRQKACQKPLRRRSALGQDAEEEASEDMKMITPEKVANKLEYPWGFEAEDSESAGVPPGYRLLSEEERLDTLEQLRQKLVELDLRYSALPLRIETEGQIRQQNHLRGKIAETEGAVQLFSRPKVLLEV